MTRSIEHAGLDAWIDRTEAEAEQAEALGYIYARVDASGNNYNALIIYDGLNEHYDLYARRGIQTLDNVEVPKADGDYFRLEVVLDQIFISQSLNRDEWTLKLAYDLSQDEEDILPEGDWYVQDVVPNGYVASGIVEKDFQEIFFIGTEQVYERPTTIAGRRIQRVSGKLHSYEVSDTSGNIFSGSLELPASGQQAIRIVHDPCAGAVLTVTAGGSLVGAATYYTYSTVATVDASGTTITVSLDGYPVTIEERAFEKEYLVFGEILDFACPIASDPTMAEAMYDHFVAVASATQYEFEMRDNPSLEIGDRLRIPLMSERTYGEWGYVLGEADCKASTTRLIWIVHVSNIIPTVLTRIEREFTGAGDAKCRVVTDINP